ncbi:MAG TPA: hypothetical protein VD902_12935 [Symbiobacteriaceae bacterium]|nr:hypothetical protein [Symbiobacteriaceae bacterium]
MAGLLIAALIVLATGRWLSRSGRPYSTLVLTVHKLVALAAIVIFGVLAYRANAASLLDALATAAACLTALLMLVSMASGGAVSTIKVPPAGLSWAHRIGSYLAVIASAIFFLAVR